MRDYEQELKNRVAFIKDTLKQAHAEGVVFGNSGGKDSALVGILCKKACDNVLGIMMPCQSKRNYCEDIEDALKVAKQFGIESKTVDLTNTKETLLKELEAICELSPLAHANINPRLRMLSIYSIAQTRNSLVAGTGNRSEAYMGYFTKWGDGACDFNPISDLTVTEIYEFLEYLNAPIEIIEKEPSAALFEGQTDEQEMGITYARIDHYLLNGFATEEDREKIKKAHQATEHKRNLPKTYQ